MRINWLPLLALLLFLMPRVSAEPASSLESTESWWPPTLAHGDRAHFASLVTERLRGTAELGTIQSGYVVATNGSQLGLSNVAQLCGQSPKEEWAQIIDSHFDKLEQSEDEHRRILADVADWGHGKKLLTVRLWGESDLPDKPGFFVTRDDLEGIKSVLTFDLPNSVTNARPEVVDKWKLPPNEVFAMALANVANLPVETQRHDLGAGIPLYLLSAEHFFAGSHVLLLDRHAECLGRFGSIVSIPHRHAVLCHPIESMTVVEAIEKLALIADGMFREGPGSISPNVYWYRDASFVRLPYELTSRSVEFSPPDSFARLLDQLPKR